jgi:hypothetical protein
LEYQAVQERSRLPDRQGVETVGGDLGVAVPVSDPVIELVGQVHQQLVVALVGPRHPVPVLQGFLQGVQQVPGIGGAGQGLGQEQKAQQIGDLAKKQMDLVAQQVALVGVLLALGTGGDVDVSPRLQGVDALYLSPQSHHAGLAQHGRQVAHGIGVAPRRVANLLPSPEGGPDIHCLLS